MRISFTPQRRDDTLTLVKAGDVLTINGDDFDFGTLSEGASLPTDAIECDWIVGDVTRIDGTIRITVVLPHGPSPSEAVAFPAPIADAPDGAIILPE